MKGKLLVLAQFSLIGLIAIFGEIREPSARFFGVGLGIVIGLWAIGAMQARVSVLPEPSHVAKLTVRGPYRLIRHPMYTAVLLTTISLVNNYLTVGFWLMLFGVLLYKMRYEEALLSSKFKDYQGYMRRTKRLIPFIY